MSGAASSAPRGMGAGPGVMVERVAGYASVVRRVSWGAVFAGMFIAIVTQILLALLGAGIGITATDPNAQNAGKGLAIGLAIWWVISSLASLYAGGWVAGRLAGFPRRQDGALHGLIAWSVVTMLSLYFVTTAVGSLASGALNVLGKGLQTAGNVAAAAPEAAKQAGISVPAADGGINDMMQQVQQVAQDPAARSELQSALSSYYMNGQEGKTPENRAAVVRVLTQRANMDPDQAEQMVSKWDQAIAQTKQAVQQTAQKTKEVAGPAAIWAFVALALGACAAAIGGGMGAPNRLIMDSTSSPQPGVQ